MSQRRFFWAAFLCVAFGGFRGRVRAEDYYVAADGDDDNAGTKAAPFATIERGEQAASPGDTVYIRGGVYTFAGTESTVGVVLSKSGERDRPIRYFAYEDELPILDLFELMPQARVTGIDVRCNWVHIRGLEVRGVRQLVVGDSWGVRIRGDHNVLERLNVHDCQAPGIFITSGASNLILNSDSHHNYDPLEDGGNADGFGCHSSGGDNVLRGCRAYENSDDGFDFINAPGTCTVERSWAFRNGFIPDTTMTGANGSGFKSGGFGNPPKIPDTGVPRHTVRGNVAFGNRVIGFYANHHPGGIDFLNNTAFDNPSNFDMRVTDATSSHTLRNNIALAPGRAIVNFEGGTDSFNSWTLPVMVSSADFISMDKALALQPRNADGSLPDTALMRLAEGSDLIDRGEDVGLAFTGDAPDLGAFEYGEAPPAPDAGMPRAGAPAPPEPLAGSPAKPGLPDGGAPSPPSGGAGTTPQAGTGAAGTSASSSDATGGCSCRIKAQRSTRGSGASMLLGPAAWLILRRRRAPRELNRSARSIRAKV